MSHPVPACPRCGQAMQEGFVLDRTYGANLQSEWIAGDPHVVKMFGMSMGTLNVNEKQACPVTCYRCPVCSYLEFYAFAKQTSEAENVLLRPAQGNAEADAQQLLRGSSGEAHQDD